MVKVPSNIIDIIEKFIKLLKEENIVVEKVINFRKMLEKSMLIVYNLYVLKEKCIKNDKIYLYEKEK